MIDAGDILIHAKQDVRISPLIAKNGKIFTFEKEQLAFKVKLLKKIGRKLNFMDLSLLMEHFKQALHTVVGEQELSDQVNQIILEKDKEILKLQHQVSFLKQQNENAIRLIGTYFDENDNSSESTEQAKHTNLKKCNPDVLFKILAIIGKMDEMELSDFSESEELEKSKDESKSTNISDVNIEMIENVLLGGNLSDESLDVDAKTFNKLMKFMSNDENENAIEIDDLEDARKLLLASKRHSYEALGQKCWHYITKNIISLENVCQVFEIAVAKKPPINRITELCFRIIVKHTEAILKSEAFLNAKLETIETILKFNTLNIDSEFKIIQAVMMWGLHRCKRNNLAPNAKNLRTYVDPLLKFLRFLSLSYEEFKQFIMNYDILTSVEISALSTKLFQSTYTMELPKNLCPFHVLRFKPPQDFNLSTEYQFTCDNAQIVLGNPIGINKSKLSDSGYLSENNKQIQDSNGDNSSNFAQSELNSKDDETTPFLLENQSDESDDEDMEPITTLMEESKAISVKLNTNEVQNGMRTVDLVSEAVVVVKKGFITVIGVVVEIKSHITKVPIIINLKSNNNIAEEVHCKTLSGPVSLIFKKPFLIETSNKLVIKVTIENLQLQLCKLCSKSDFEWLSENNRYNIKINSNQGRQGKNTPCLISKILYTCN